MMARVPTRHDPDRRRIASPRLKRRLMARMAFTGLIVLVAVSLAFGPVGIGLGVALVAGIGVLIHLARRRQSFEFGRLPDGRVGR